MTQPIVTPGDLDIAWRTVWQEARDQGFQGMLGVAWVLRNRRDFKRNDRWNTLAQTCLDWLQFSAWREADPNYLPSLRADLDELGLLCLKAVATVLTADPAVDDFTHGARHYFNPRLAAPPWAKGHQPCFTHRDHAFYNTVA